MHRRIKKPPLLEQRRPKKSNTTNEIYRKGPLYPTFISSIEQIKLAKCMHELAETMPHGCDAYFHIIAAFDRMTGGEFMKHYLEVNNE